MIDCLCIRQFHGYDGLYVDGCPIHGLGARKIAWWIVGRQRDLSEGSAMHSGCEDSLAAELTELGIDPVPGGTNDF